MRSGRLIWRSGIRDGSTRHFWIARSTSSDDAGGYGLEAADLRHAYRYARQCSGARYRPRGLCGSPAGRLKPGWTSHGQRTLEREHGFSNATIPSGYGADLIAQYRSFGCRDPLPWSAGCATVPKSLSLLFGIRGWCFSLPANSHAPLARANARETREWQWGPRLARRDPPQSQGGNRSLWLLPEARRSPEVRGAFRGEPWSLFDSNDL